ncbi:MAG TPA: hypothetical protein VM238_14195 [Phycisphaerae bacterium]|nr:hypothetical protein [Phycisphaerae bacterium]HUU92346.1 hypothetical protein [Phycisphaerae bacterium]
MPTLKPSDLTPEVRKALGLPPERKSTFTKEDVRSYAIRCLAPLAGLTKGQRKRVLHQALAMNDV